jgi:hypothetical protein
LILFISSLRNEQKTVSPYLGASYHATLWSAPSRRRGSSGDGALAHLARPPKAVSRFAWPPHSTSPDNKRFGGRAEMHSLTPWLLLYGCLIHMLVHNRFSIHQDSLALYPLADYAFRVNLKGNFDWYENLSFDTAIKSSRKKKESAAQVFSI